MGEGVEDDLIDGAGWEVSDMTLLARRQLYALYLGVGVSLDAFEHAGKREDQRPVEVLPCWFGP